MQDARADLIREGRELFARYGLKGTSVRDLTRAVGIAQGSFYSAFESKEVLFFAILEQEEAGIAERFVARLHAQPMTRGHLKAMIEWSLQELRTNPILRTVLDPDEYRRMLRKIPRESLERHRHREEDVLTTAVATVVADGSIAPIDSKELSGLFHALFVLTLHQEVIGADLFPKVLDRLIALVADHVATQGEPNV